MDALERFERLAAEAQREEPPVTDAWPGVLRRISRQEEPSLAPLRIFAAAAACAAAAALLLTVHFWTAWDEPLASLLPVLEFVL